jgi:hypothetical protein
MFILSKLIYRFKSDSVKTQKGSFGAVVVEEETGKLILTTVWKYKGLKIAKQFLEERKQN